MFIIETSRCFTNSFKFENFANIKTSTFKKVVGYQTHMCNNREQLLWGKGRDDVKGQEKKHKSRHSVKLNSWEKKY